MLICFDRATKLQVSSGEPIAHATLAGTQDSSNPTQYVPLWTIRLEKSTSQKLDLPFGSSSMVISKFFIWEKENKMGTSPVSSTWTLVAHGGVVGKWRMQLSRQVSVSELANTKDLLQVQNSVVIPEYNACFWNLLIAVLDPIDCVQPRSRTTCVGWWARSKGTDAIHAVCLELYHAAVQVEESSVKLENQSSDSQE